MLLKGFVIAFFGIAVCGAIIGFAVTQELLLFLAGEPMPAADVAGSVAFCVPAGVVLAISWRAAVRTSREGGQGAFGWLARLAPVLMLVGVVGGVLFARTIRAGQLESRERDAQQLCEVPEFWKLDDASCLPAARACVTRAWAGAEPDPAALQALQARLLDLARRRAEAENAHREDETLARHADFGRRLNEDITRARSATRDADVAAMVCLAARPSP